MHSRIRLRISNEAWERKSKSGQGTAEFKRALNDKHAIVFFFVGMAVNLNLDTSLLTERVFEVENFTNITIFLYFSVVVIVCILYMFLIPPDFWQLVAGVWTLSASRFCHLLLSIFAHGKSGRNLFLLFYSINGFLRGIISLTSSHVIGEYFLIESYIHFINGSVFFSILSSLLQIIVGLIIGDETVRQVRRNLVICQSAYLSETLFASIWVTIIFIEYHSDINKAKEEHKKNEEGQKYSQAIKKFTYIRYYISKFFVSFFASLFRVVFHPVLIPYMMDVPNVNKLLASIVFTFSEFLGRLTTFQIDEYIDASKKAHDISNTIFLFRQDLHLYLLFCYQFIICTLAVYSTWFQKYGISKNPYFVTFITMTSGLVSGYNDNRAVRGSEAVLHYYSKPKNIITSKDEQSSSSNNSSDITPEIAKDTSNVSDVITLLSYSSFLVGCLISYYLQHAIIRRKETLEFIILSHKKYIDKESVKILAKKLNL
ncbi:putative integral membrane protein [Theileria parva strain Muguga]|uniref:putative integral membrane protein n=1 Tax=Theileria parva strain Muguga TaxID=333668 RepID=UPI001C619A64|nr:putative integral membrane protein [Theileria parva strain Muguga]KAF5153681.1 putative integral membrane protein [Theileria parva strain Muguga]